MANNRRPQNAGRRMDYGRNDRSKPFGRPGVSPWQGGGPGAGISSLLPLGGGSTEATLALANNLISNLLQTRQNAVPSLLDMPIRRDFGPDMGRYDHGGFGGNRMGNQGNFRRTGNYTRTGERMNNHRKPFRPNDGQRQQNRSAPKKEADSKAKTVKESEQGTNSENPDAKTEGSAEVTKEAPKTRYDDLDPSLLKCHICNKSMWDGRSFENHLNGRAHAIMMQKTSESYALTADTMRQEFKIREMKRTRKAGQQTPRDFYCAMCDMYAGDGVAHRTTVGHRKLKKYLHPACTSCHKEMPTRIELDEHRLTPEHLRNMHDKQEVTSKPKPEVMLISTFETEMSYIRDDRNRKRPAAEDNAVKKEPEDAKADGETDQAEAVEEKKEEQQDAEDAILDYKDGDDLANISQEMLPNYSTERGVGGSFISEFRCFQCTLCNKLMDSQQTADVHLKTWRHHQLFVRMLRDKAGLTEGTKRALNASTEEPTENSGNWKRRKTSVDEEEKDDEIVVKEEDVEKQPADKNGGDNAAEDGEDPNWEETLDELLTDEGVSANGNGKEEQNGDADEAASEPDPIEEKAVEEEQQKASPPPTPAAKVAELSKPRASPRSRGRGAKRN